MGFAGGFWGADGGLGRRGAGRVEGLVGRALPEGTMPSDSKKVETAASTLPCAAERKKQAVAMSAPVMSTNLDMAAESAMVDKEGERRVGWVGEYWLLRGIGEVARRVAGLL